MNVIKNARTTKTHFYLWVIVHPSYFRLPTVLHFSSTAFLSQFSLHTSFCIAYSVYSLPSLAVMFPLPPTLIIVLLNERAGQ